MSRASEQDEAIRMSFPDKIVTFVFVYMFLGLFISVLVPYKFEYCISLNKPPGGLVRSGKNNMGLIDFRQKKHGGLIRKREKVLKIA